MRAYGQSIVPDGTSTLRASIHEKEAPATSYSQRDGSLQAGPGQYVVVVQPLGLAALVPELETRSRTAELDRDDDLSCAPDQYLVCDHRPLNIVSKLMNVTAETRSG
jgi:hypothetical protein